MRNLKQICIISMVDIRTVFFEHIKRYVQKTANVTYYWKNVHTKLLWNYTLANCKTLKDISS